MKAYISELIYTQETQSEHNSWEHRMPYKEMFQSMDIDFTIQLENLITFHQCWEKYHNNTIWCQLGLIRDDSDKVLMASQGYPANEITDQKPYGPSMRIDIGTLHEVAICEKHSIPYELILKMKIKYIHVKMRRRVL
tara:strand:+ start:1077 stop:1487 length:411 start_codon:yes stop_codon:yes gene_type:complete